MKTLVLGGVKSGKSRYAEGLAMQSQNPVTVIATAQALDEEMRQRIARHKANRPNDWSVLEVPLQLSEALQSLTEQTKTEQCVIVDCLTLWLTQLISTDASIATLQQERLNLVEAVDTFKGEIILVSNETNMGITPLGELSRQFCDEAGLLHQALAQVCDNVTLVIAGIPQQLK